MSDKRIVEEGVYSVPQEEYHADPVIEPSFSASMAHTLLSKSARHAWLGHPRLNPGMVRESKGYLDFGELAHALMLGDERNFEIIQADNWRTNAAKAARDAARATGKIPALVEEFERAKLMVRAGKAQLDVHDDLHGCFRGGQGEVTLVWREPVPDRKTEVWCRCRLDYLHGTGFNYIGAPGFYPRLDLPQFKPSTQMLVDYKTTGISARPDLWGAKSMFNNGNDLRAAFYARGAKRVLGFDRATYLFAVQETKEPFALSVIAPTFTALDRANANLDQALDYFVWCREKNFWPGYEKRTVFVDLPNWLMREWMDREELGRKLSVAERDELFATGLAFQAPLGVEDAVGDEDEGGW